MLCFMFLRRRKETSHVHNIVILGWTLKMNWILIENWPKKNVFVKGKLGRVYSILSCVNSVNFSILPKKRVYLWVYMILASKNVNSGEFTF